MGKTSEGIAGTLGFTGESARRLIFRRPANSFDNIGIFFISTFGVVLRPEQIFAPRPSMENESECAQPAARRKSGGREIFLRRAPDSGGESQYIGSGGIKTHRNQPCDAAAA